MGVRLLPVPALTYLYLCRPGRHHLECYKGALPNTVTILNLTAENGVVRLLLESEDWEGGTVEEPVQLAEPAWRMLRDVPQPPHPPKRRKRPKPVLEDAA